MKKLKLLVLLIILALLGFFIYQNINYFMTEETVGIHFRSFDWTSPELPVLVYWGICLAAGFLIAGIRGFAKSFVLGRELKKKNLIIQEQEIQISDLNTRINDLTRTPANMTAPAASEASQLQTKDQGKDGANTLPSDEKPSEQGQEQTETSQEEIKKD